MGQQVASKQRFIAVCVRAEQPQRSHNHVQRLLLGVVGVLSQLQNTPNTTSNLPLMRIG